MYGCQPKGLPVQMLTPTRIEQAEHPADLRKHPSGEFHGVRTAARLEDTLDVSDYASPTDLPQSLCSRENRLHLPCRCQTSARWIPPGPFHTGESGPEPGPGFERGRPKFDGTRNLRDMIYSVHIEFKLAERVVDLDTHGGDDAPESHRHPTEDHRLADASDLAADFLHDDHQMYRKIRPHLPSWKETGQIPLLKPSPKARPTRTPDIFTKPPGKEKSKKQHHNKIAPNSS
jgi:hypothetical protein